MRPRASWTRLRTAPVPWGRPRHELLLLALVASVALAPVYVISSQDVSRLCLTRSLLHGGITIDGCIGDAVDRAEFEGHTYSDKAPGMSVLAIPAAAATRLPHPGNWSFESDAHVWAVRLLTSGVAFVLLAFAVGRTAEGLAPGWGGPTLVAFSLGTLVTPLAATSFSHVTAALLAFGAFLLASRGRAGPAGLLAGAGIAVEYTLGLVAIALAAYVLLAGTRPLLRYVLGAAGPVVLLGAYHWAAFGNPLHLPYRYIENRYAHEQARGFFGIHLPRLDATRDVFAGSHGVLTTSPVLVAGAAGLVLLARRRRPLEAALAGAVAVAFVLLNCGYFLPYGGISPGPRFLVPALPFLALGLGPAFARWPRTTTALAAVSVAATTVTLTTWSRYDEDYRSPWAQLGDLVGRSSRVELFDHVDWSVLAWAGVNRNLAAGLLVAAALGTLLVAVAAAGLVARARRERRWRLPATRRTV